MENTIKVWEMVRRFIITVDKKISKKTLIINDNSTFCDNI